MKDQLQFKLKDTTLTSDVNQTLSNLLRAVSGVRTSLKAVSNLATVTSKRVASVASNFIATSAIPGAPQELNPATVTLTKSSVLNTQGSIAAVGENTFSYTSTTTSVTWTWGAFTVWYPDGSSFVVAASAGTTISGLTASTTYYFGFYVNISTKQCYVVLSDVSGGTAAHSAQQIVTLINGDGNTAINYGVSVTTPASGSGGGSGGGRGGAGGKLQF